VVSQWKFITAVTNEPVARNKRVTREIHVWSKLIIERAAKRRISNISTARLLVQECVRNVERESSRKTTIQFNLQRMRSAPAGVTVGGKKIAKERKWPSSSVSRRYHAILFINRTTQV